MEVFLYAAKFDCYDKTDTLYFIIGTLVFTLFLL